MKRVIDHLRVLVVFKSYWVRFLMALILWWSDFYIFYLVVLTLWRNYSPRKSCSLRNAGFKDFFYG